jgi:hypothetical protein
MLLYSFWKISYENSYVYNAIIGHRNTTSTMLLITFETVINYEVLYFCLQHVFPNQDAI